MSWPGNVFVRRRSGLTAVLAGPERRPFTYQRMDCLVQRGANHGRVGACSWGSFVLTQDQAAHNRVRVDDIGDRGLTVALTAYNDEESISSAVSDFLSHPMVRRVIVVSNNSVDATFERAVTAGAITVNETAPGYGRCLYRCLTEALHYDDTELIVLCEGDRTFRAFDINKLVAFAPHAEIVNGTRTVECLRQYSTQLSTFMYYGKSLRRKVARS